MRIFNSLFFIVAIMCISCSSNSTNNSENGQSDSTKPDTVNQRTFQLEQDFEKAWRNFVHAVIDGDIEAVRNLSSDCILCPVCLTNTLKEVAMYEDVKKKNPNTWYDKFYLEHIFVPIDQFMKEDFPIILEPDLKSLMLDTSKTSLRDDKVNKKMYDKGCIISNSDFNESNLSEALVFLPDPSREDGGYQKAFAFIRTRQGYKFCGYSTIP